MYRLIVPVDEDEDRVRRQINTIESDLLAADKMEVHLVHVYEEIDTKGSEGGASYIDDLNESLEEFRDPPETVDRVATAFEDRDIETELHELVGDPAQGILSMANEVDGDAILIGIRERSPVGKVVFGSVSQKVIIGSDVPVIVAR